MGKIPEVGLGLTPKEQLFCEYYASQNYVNATQAYLKAYGCGYNTANARGHLLLKKESVKNYLLDLQKESYNNALITPERIATELAKVAFAAKGDKEYNASAKLKALDLLQKQFALQNQRIETKTEDIVIEVNINE